MDPFSQAAVGAAAAQTKARGDSFKQAAIIGALAGMAPDLDILIRSQADPLLALEFHRHFTHSLFFIPIGALLVAGALYLLLKNRWQLSFGWFYLFSLLGYATHGLLDGCTTYGTQLLWPISDYRVAWNTISVVDPLFTLPLIALLILATRRQSRALVFVGISWAFTYLILGWWQSERAEALGQQLAAERGHTPISLQAKPGFANILLWKIVYEYDGYFYVDAVRPGLSQPSHWEGERIQKLDINRDLYWLAEDTQQYRDVERFAHFSSDYIALDPDDSNSIIDIRYSALPHQIDPMWGITLSQSASADAHADYFERRPEVSGALQELGQMLFR